VAEWKNVTANIDYHVEVDKHYYSVRYQLANAPLEARYSASVVEIYNNSRRVAAHVRAYDRKYRCSTIAEHSRAKCRAVGVVGNVVPSLFVSMDKMNALVVRGFKRQRGGLEKGT
jgi:transposase